MLQQLNRYQFRTPTRPSYAVPASISPLPIFPRRHSYLHLYRDFRLTSQLTIHFKHIFKKTDSKSKKISTKPALRPLISLSEHIHTISLHHIMSNVQPTIPPSPQTPKHNPHKPTTKLQFFLPPIHSLMSIASPSPSSKLSLPIARPYSLLPCSDLYITYTTYVHVHLSI